MIQDTLVRSLTDATASAASDLGCEPDAIPQPQLTRPRHREHGDWSTNVALVLAPRVEKPARAVAEAIAGRLGGSAVISKVEVAGPGFINLFLRETWLHEELRDMLRAGPRYGRSQRLGQRTQVEFVSANPTGPIHVGTARNAAIGDSLANVLEAAGYDVWREYYFNNAGRQLELFGASVEAAYLQSYGVAAAIPEEGYHGTYVLELARAIKDEFGDGLVQADPVKRRQQVLDESIRLTVERIRGTLRRFGVEFDSWFYERELHESGAIDQVVERLKVSGFAYEAEGATFFRATQFGDDKDRVLVRSNGEPTYFAADCAYLLQKVTRGFDRLLYVWGADHHGDVKRMIGAAQALGLDPHALDIVLYQLVSLYRGGQPVRMSKRAGEMITLDELLDEVGPDSARYTLLTRSSDSPLDFDIEAVKRQSLENPVYYVQYAHARIASLDRTAADRGISTPPWSDVALERLAHRAEADLIRILAELPEAVELAASSLAPHRLTRYAEQVATAFHRFYTECRVITEDEPLTHARLWLARATRQVLATTLSLIGVSAPESMERTGAGDD